MGHKKSKKYSKLVNLTTKKQTHRYRELVVTSGEREGRQEQYRGRGLRCKLLYISYKDILCNMRNVTNIL